MELSTSPMHTLRRMPDLAGGTHAHHHTVHSALMSLQAMGVSAHRITLRRVGRHALGAGAVVQQSPRAGAELHPSTRVELSVAGLGFLHGLPVGMWETGGEHTAGTREILEAIDDPLEKLKHWFHEGAPLFRIAPENPAACARWLSLFGMNAEEWPQAMWYPLASVVAQLPQLSCSIGGCEFLLQVLLGLPVRGTHYRPTVSTLPAETLSKLGARSSRLGLDLLLGNAVEDAATLVIDLGPVKLPIYERFAETGEGRDLLRRVLDLIMPASSIVAVEWTVEDLRSSPQLGFPDKNARLGINTHMGMALAAEAPAPGSRASLEDAVWSTQ